MEFIWKPFAQLSTTELYALLGLRQQVFMLEQQSLYSDIDDADPQAYHLLAYQNHTRQALGAYLRVLPKTDGITIGRVVVAKPLRGQGLGLELLKTALEWMACKYSDRPIYLSSQVDCQPFYARLGFGVISKPYDDAGVLHIDMRKPTSSG